MSRYPRTADLILSEDDSPLVRAMLKRVETHDFHARSVWNWLLKPYTGWATQPDRYDLPASLLQFMANPPTPYWAAIRACTVCGLKVPSLTHPNGDQPFATCPACSSPTDERAIFGPPGTEEFESAWE